MVYANKIDLNNNPHGLKPRTKNWDRAVNFASMVCSRESTYRTGLDLGAFDIPTLGAAAFRGWSNFLEAGLECGMGTIAVVTAPAITSVVGRACSKFILPKDLQKDAMHLLRFSMSEARENRLEEGLERIRRDEPHDKEFTAQILEKSGIKTAERFRKEAEDIKDFCNRFQASDDMKDKIYRLKKATLLGESLIEGGWWGSFGLILRWFRKNVLNESGFTGTNNYLSEAESSQLGQNDEMTFVQKAMGAFSVIVSQLINFSALNAIEKHDKNPNAKPNKFIDIAKNQLDMTHGIYPTIGLLFSFTTIPKWLGSISLAQGWFERSERIIKLFTVISSWWLGHRATNGLIAKKEDKILAEKYNVNEGILLKPESVKPKSDSDSFLTTLGRQFPEPAHIQHVLETTKENPYLQYEAEDKHASTLYKGFTLHCVGVFLINMAVNQLTKIRSLSAAGK